MLVKVTRGSEAGSLPTAELLAAMGRCNQQWIDARILRVEDGLKPSSQGKRFAFDGQGRTVIDGPIAVTRELAAGLWLWQVKNMDEAVAWARGCPNPTPGPSELALRPLYETADFA